MSKNTVLEQVLGQILAEFISIALAWWLYNRFLAIPLGLPQVTYWQMWIVRVLLGYMANTKIIKEIR